MADWKRPESVPYPSVWRTFQKTGSNGVKRTFWVQDITEEYKDAFLQVVGKGFVRDESMCKAINAVEDSKSVEEFLNFWNSLLEQKLGIICLTKDEGGNIQIVGGNAVYRTYKGQMKSVPVTGTPIFRYLSCGFYIKDSADIFTKFNTDHYLTAAGLYVLPQFRGLGIATEILKARRELSLAVGINRSVTLFTSSFSQKCAAEAGFKELFEITYKELEEKNPTDWSFPGISSKSLKLMYIEYHNEK